MACPGSVALSSRLGDTPTNKHMAEGSLAHRIAEFCLRENLSAAAAAEVGSKQTQDGFTFKIDQAFVDAVQSYIDICRKDMAVADDFGVETKIHCPKIHKQYFGTADFWAWFKDGEHLIVRDYKHGAGKAVEIGSASSPNTQLLYYAVGLVEVIGKKPKRITLDIVQPRLPHADGPHRSVEITDKDLAKARIKFKKQMRIASGQNPPLHTGSWCDWCPAAAACPELQRKTELTAARDFSPEAAVDPATLAQAYLVEVPLMEARIKAIREMAYSLVESGTQLPGLKLVAKRGTRKFRDEAKALKVLAMCGYDNEQLYKEPALKSPAQMEKSGVSKKVLEKLTSTISSGHTLVPESDKRPALRATAAEDFADVAE